jgi:hypothetical protein
MEKEDIFAGIPTEGSNPFEQEATGKPEEPAAADSQPEKAESKSEPSQEGEKAVADAKPANSPDVSNDPSRFRLDKHPRFREVIQEKNRLSERVNQMEAALKDMQSRQSSQSQRPPEIPSWFQDVFGQNPELWQKYQQFTQSERDTIIQQIRSQQEESVKREAAEREHWAKWRDESLSTIEDRYNVDFSTPQGQSLKNEFFAFVKRVKPTDDQGNLDLVNGWSFFMEYARKPEEAKAQAKKQLASAVSPDGKPETKQRGFVTSKDLRNKGFHDLVRS